jgi:hypothetical protein
MPMASWISVVYLKARICSTCAFVVSTWSVLLPICYCRGHSFEKSKSYHYGSSIINQIRNFKEESKRKILESSRDESETHDII